MSWWQVFSDAPAEELWSLGAVAVEHRRAHFVHRAEALSAGGRLVEGAPDWTTEWMAQHHAVRISERLAVAPSWVHVDAPIVLRIDPGLAFGTGTHPTTQLCLEQLCALDLRGQRILDVGTGTGVLGIAALKLGGAEVVGTDIDNVALRTAERLARRHGVSLKLTRTAEGHFDLVLANLPPEAQESLAAHVSGAVAPGGTLVLSGFLEDVDVEDLYPAFEVVSRSARSGWVCLLLRR